MFTIMSFVKVGKFSRPRVCFLSPSPLLELPPHTSWSYGLQPTTLLDLVTFSSLSQIYIGALAVCMSV